MINGRQAVKQNELQEDDHPSWNIYLFDRCSHV